MNQFEAMTYTIISSRPSNIHKSTRKKKQSNTNRQTGTITTEADRYQPRVKSVPSKPASQSLTFRTVSRIIYGVDFYCAAPYLPNAKNECVPNEVSDENFNRHVIVCFCARLPPRHMFRQAGNRRPVFSQKTLTFKIFSESVSQSCVGMHTRS